MGFFSDIADGVTKFFSGGDAVSALVETGVNFFGEREAQKANDRAADLVSQASFRNAQAITDATAAANKRFDEQQELSRVGTDVLRTIAASDPSQLTPAQIRALEDSQRDAQATIAATGLRGAGRATVAALQETDARFREGAQQDNINRQLEAATRLSGQDFSAGTNAAQVSFRGIPAAAEAASKAAEPLANADIANTRLRGGGLADISSLIADETKTRGRQSRYSNEDKEEEIV